MAFKLFDDGKEKEINPEDIIPPEELKEIEEEEEKREEEKRRKEEEERKKRERTSKHLETFLPIFGFVLIGRGLVNLFIPFDEYFIGENASMLLNILTLLGGFGVLARTQWGFLLAFWMSLIALIAQSETNIMERTGGEIMSILLMGGLWKAYDLKKFVKGKYDNKVAFVLILVVFGMIVADGLKPSPEEYAARVTKEAVEKGDWRVCERLEPGYKDLCIKSYAVEKRNPEICGMVDTRWVKNECYTHVAIKTDNLQICDKIDKEDARGICQSIVNRNIKNKG